MLVPLLDFNRHSEDNSEQIQELMRRKKELNVECRTERLNTLATSRRVLGTWGARKDKEKMLFYHNDDG